MLIQTNAPASEPVTLAEAKLNMRVDGDEEDSLITLHIAAARRYAESYTGRSFITQGWRLVLDGFATCVELERGDVQAISSITYRDLGGTTRTVAWNQPVNGIQRSVDGALVADLSSCPARIAPSFGSVWPIATSEIGAVAIDYTAGYGSAASDVPEGVRSWILLRVGSLYANREESVPGVVTALPYVDTLLDPYTVALA